MLGGRPTVPWQRAPCTTPAWLRIWLQLGGEDCSFRVLDLSLFVEISHFNFKFPKRWWSDLVKPARLARMDEGRLAFLNCCRSHKPPYHTEREQTVAQAVAGEEDWFSVPVLWSAYAMLIRLEFNRKCVWAQHSHVKWIGGIHPPLSADAAVFRQTPARLISGADICPVWLFNLLHIPVMALSDLFNRNPVLTSTLQRANISYWGGEQVEQIHKSPPVTVVSLDKLILDGPKAPQRQRKWSGFCFIKIHQIYHFDHRPELWGCSYSPEV